MVMNSPASDLSHKLAEIGASLRQKRLDKGLTLQQVYYGTLIPEKHLQAIEEGNADALPETIYVQGFIRKYASFIGADDLIEDLPVVTVQSSANWHHAPTFQLNSWHLYGLYILVVITAVSALASSLTVNPYRIDDGEVPSPTPSAAPFPVTATGAPVSPTPSNPQSLNLTINMVGESWMRVTIDGKVAFEGILSEGKTVEWSGQKQILLRVGNGAAVTFSYNRSPMQVLGNEGEVVEKAFGTGF
jgi:cytoskeleton protein RodZ